MISFSFALTIAFMSWTNVLPMHWANSGWSDFYEVVHQLYQMYIHTVPLVTTTINTLILTDTIGYIIDIWMVPLIAIAYCLTSYIHFLITGGEYQYPFLNWNQWDSLLTAGGVSVVTTLWYGLFVELT